MRRYVKTILRDISEITDYIHNVEDKGFIEYNESQMNKYINRKNELNKLYDELNENYKGKCIRLFINRVNDITYCAIGIIRSINDYGLHIQGMRILNDKFYKSDHLVFLDKVKSIEAEVISQAVLDDYLSQCKCNLRDYKYNK